VRSPDIQDSTPASPVRFSRKYASDCAFVDVGLDYLTINRSADHSRAAVPRIRSPQIGSRLVGVLYILMSPASGASATTAGCSPRSSSSATRQHCHRCEHDEETIRDADYLIDLGPGAGKHGGEVIAAGSVQDVMNTEASVTGAYLRGTRSIPVPKTRRAVDPKRMLVVEGAREHNLREVTAEFPLGMFVAVTGVSGSGKSTLVTDILQRSLSRHFYRARVIPGAHDRIRGFEHLDKIIDIDQSPIGRTPRSNPATYTGVFTPIRELFAELPEAKIRGYGPGRFSFNVKGGRCEARGGRSREAEMHSVFVPCDVCKGKRFNRETMEVRFRGMSIAEVLDLTVEEGHGVRESTAHRAEIRTLRDVGLHPSGTKCDHPREARHSA
jgi:excinuclease ABC subunit A